MKKIITNAGVAATLLSLSFGAVEASAEEGYWDNYRQEQQEYWGNYRQTKQTEAAQKRQETQDYWAIYRNNKTAEAPQEAELETKVESEAETASTTQEAETAVPAKETAQQVVENTPEKIDSYSDHIQAASNFWTDVDEVVDAPHVRINRRITSNLNNHVNKNTVNNLADEYQAPHLRVARGVLNFLDRIFN